MTKFDHDKDHPKQVEANYLVRAIWRDDNVKLAMTPLTDYNVMRGVRRIDLAQMQAILDDLQAFKTTDKAGNFASTIYHKTAKQTDNHHFAIFHLAVCQIRQLPWQVWTKILAR